MSRHAIEVRGVGKRYELGAGRRTGETFRELITGLGSSAVQRIRASSNGARSKKETIWALKDVSFDINEGEVVGIIGRNGAGKSTLLKVLSRITEPSTGHIDVWGRVGSLLEVGTGFHPELSGRENVYLNGAILGMRQKEIERQFDEIVAFAEVERFIDTPVKHYSSGMYLRLAFAVAAHLEPEILVVDEVLAVGDSAFQAKCIGRMSAVAHEGRTVLFVSHNMAAVENLCQRIIWMAEGQKVGDGPTHEVLPAYLAAGRTPELQPADRADRSGDGRFRFTTVAVHDERGQAVDYVQAGQACAIVLGYSSQATDLRRVSVTVTVHDQYERCLLRLRSAVMNQDFLTLPSQGQLTCRIPRLPLMPGTYPVGLACTVEGVAADIISNVHPLRVVDGDFHGTGRLPPAGSSIFLTDYDWSSAG